MTPNQAYSRVRTAIKNGILVRPAECNRCGVTPGFAVDGRPMIQAHHHDYEKPLDVEWVCTKCHREETPLPKVMGAPNLGEKNGSSKLKVSDVIEARRLRLIGSTYQSIANRFGVDKKTAMRAVKGELWKCVSVAAAPSPEGEGK